MQNKFIKREEVIELIENHFLQEHVTLKAHPKNEQNIIGSKLVVIEIELKKLIKNLTVTEINEEFSAKEEVNIPTKQHVKDEPPIELI